MSSFAPPSSRAASVRPSRGRALRVLVVDDEATARRSLAAKLLEHGFDVLTAEDGDAALSLLDSSPVDVVLADLEMPGARGVDLMQRVKATREGVEFVIVANAANASEAARCTAEGAFLFLLRPLPSDEALAIAVSRAGERKRMLERARLLDRKVGQEAPRLELVATSRSMRLTVEGAFSAAGLRTPMLLIGELGTGKELLARAVHQRSQRADHSFVVVRCSALAHDTPDAGWLELAERGTLLLQDVGDLLPSLQARLLDVLEQGEPNVRVMASCAVEPKTLVDAGTLRSDLFYRLNIVAVRIPALRRRKDDIPVLAYHLLHRSARRLGRDVRRISPEALRVLRGYEWPGNVGELESVIERAIVLARGDVILPGDLEQAHEGPDHGEPDVSSPRITAGVQLPAGFDLLPFPEAKKRVVDSFEQAYARSVLARSGGNVAEAAHLSGLDRSNFRRILKRQDVSSRGGSRRAAKRS